MSQRERQDAPGSLEVVRAFLTTWCIPNDTRVPADLLSSAEAVERFQATHFPHLTGLSPGQAADGEIEVLHRLRSDLRQALRSDETTAVTIITTWLESFPLSVALEMIPQGSAAIKYRPGLAGSALCGALLALVVEAWAEKTWRRLKVCPDCQTVFYDYTKNTSRVWCGMFAHGPDGRACGSIAKVRRWRQRQREKQSQQEHDE